MHTLSVQPDIYQKIVSGVKTIEIRLNDEKRQLLKVGDPLIIQKEPDRYENLRATITDLITANSFKELLKVAKVKDCGFDSEQECLETLRKFYSEESEKYYGVVGIKIKINN